MNLSEFEELSEVEKLKFLLIKSEQSFNIARQLAMYLLKKNKKLKQRNLMYREWCKNPLNIPIQSN